MTPSPARVRVVVLGFVFALGVAGCSSSPKAGEKPVHPVKGKVLYKGQPAAGAEVLFVPVNEPAQNPDPRPRATVEDDGSFALSTYGDKDGAPAGEYVVLVTWPGKVLPDGREEPEDKLFGRYGDRNRPQLRAAVQAGNNELEPFALK